MPPLEHRSERQAGSAHAYAQSHPDPALPPHTPALAIPSPLDSAAIQRGDTPQLTSMRSGAPRLALRVEGRRNPRLLGALAYAMPLLPALGLLLRERRNRFVRAHAAQALVFFAALALAQIALFALLVVAGGLTSSLRAATILAALFALAWLAVAALSFVCWTRLVAAALAGRVASLPLLTPMARCLLHGLDRIAVTLGRSRNRRSGTVEGSPRRITFS